MSIFEQLAEARIREWEQQKHNQPTQQTQTQVQPTDPLDVQLFKEILKLREQAFAANNPAEQDKLRQRASELQTQLMILLEQSNRPLAAQQIAENLMKHTAFLNRQQR